MSNSQSSDAQENPCGPSKTEKAQDKHGMLTELAGDKHLPQWARTLLSIILVPIITVALLLFLYSKFAGLEDEFAMIAEGYAYSLTDGPVNKQSTEMGKMVEIMQSQLDAIEQIRTSSDDLKDQLMATMNRIEGRMDGLEKRIGGLEDWAKTHSNDPKADFYR